MTKFFSIESLCLLFLTETWLNADISYYKIFLSSSYNNVARSDRDIGQHGGLLIVDTKQRYQDNRYVQKRISILATILCFWWYNLFLYSYLQSPGWFSLSSWSWYSMWMYLWIQQKIRSVIKELSFNQSFFYIIGDFNFRGTDWSLLSFSCAREISFL